MTDQKALDHPIIGPAVRRFDAWAASQNDDAGYIDSGDYYTDYRILADGCTDEEDCVDAADDRLLIADVGLDDELHQIRLFIFYNEYEDDVFTIRHLVVQADTDYSDIPIDRTN